MYSKCGIFPDEKDIPLNEKYLIRNLQSISSKQTGF